MTYTATLGGEFIYCTIDWMSAIYRNCSRLGMWHFVAPSDRLNAAPRNTFLQLNGCPRDTNRYNAILMFDIPIMFARNQISVIFTPSRCVNLTLTLIALSSHCMAMSDPFATESQLRHDATQNTPCANIQTNQPLDLTSVVNMTLCNNPQTREVWANSRAQAAQVGVTQAGYLPSVSASATGTQSTPGNSQRTLGLNLSYLLYDFGARAANLESARQLLTSVNATEDSTVQTLFLTAVQNFYQTQAAIAALEAATTSERATQESFEVARARYQAGSATPADQFAAQTAYSQATLNRITASGAAKIAQGNLANMLGLDANMQVTLSAPSPLGASTSGGENMKLFEQNITELIEQARRNRPDLQAAEATLKSAEALADSARAAAKPTLSLTASSNQSNSAGINTHGSSMGLSMSVPLFTGYAPTYRIRAAEAQIETRRAQMERIRLQVALDVWTAYQNLITATQNNRTTADLLNSAEQSERMALGRYKAGAGIMLDVLNAQTTLASARQQRIQANLNWNISRAAFAQAMGNLNAGSLRTDEKIQ
jgi:TolC family type I secretion outer membrane protein